ncbi:heterogeneous nuclear ribonucleoprotein 1-like [Solanum dulcamara]|uniref:heterogeneous nuclear ribonucleoprotein 1-like n=1 Tax=Solanum dulcamara TaxID=45834 RepID=UPI0024852856|nr:heterogeneous nuclear ribonucleoprotein 1-like [Solanum dulcamara]XP_055801237.1 heterogeneous nuclear ribonucleoprotein 1-like [Solanum dulcamara]XP_055801238.1 heterogeneous nuclear ribonucleoprotein 1-like [Solanum dulcamara]XP_055801239.1 heterogeneous nuclear ribonucleoprotein 1-like [Solanum dulcamara]XP_055801240.1 heterogeneous nuclear ribonucleoprotein 1-like [Solanum dulcamara]
MESGKVFVGGISWDTNDDRLREYFQAFGDVVEAVIMKDRITGRARGFGFVVFADPSIAENVVKEKHIIDGRTVEAKKAVPRDDQHVNRTNGSIQGSPCPARTRKIFVGGLASSVTESDFKKYFDQFGTVTDVVVMYDHNTQRPRGFGFITYESEEAVDKVLYKTFHELNGKRVEVKRAVPKELSPGPTQSQIVGRYNHGMNRVNNFLNVYAQGYSPSSMGSYGVGMEGRYSPIPVGHNGYSLFGPADYNMGTEIDSRLNSSYGGSGKFSSILGYGRNLNSFHNENSNKYNVPIGHAPGRVGNGPVLNSTGQNKWENESLFYGTDYANTSTFVGSGSGNAGLSGVFGGLGTTWGTSSISGQGGRNGFFGDENITLSVGENGFPHGAGYGQNARTNADAKSSYTPTQGVHANTFGDFNGMVGSSIFEDFTWGASSPELDSPEALSYGLGSADSLSYVGGYSVANRSTRGIAA